MLEQLILMNALDAATLLTIETDLQSKRDNYLGFEGNLEVVDKALALIDNAFKEDTDNKLSNSAR